MTYSIREVTAKDAAEVLALTRELAAFEQMECVATVDQFGRALAEPCCPTLPPGGRAGGAGARMAAQLGPPRGATATRSLGMDPGEDGVARLAVVERHRHRCVRCRTGAGRHEQ